jgi:hypothetical protein
VTEYEQTISNQDFIMRAVVGLAALNILNFSCFYSIESVDDYTINN